METGMNEPSPKTGRVLYFDIDGTINDYQDQVKPVFRNGRLQTLLHDLGFDRLICVSGWATMVRDAEAIRSFSEATEADLIEAVRQVIADAFPDRGLFHRTVELRYENDLRCDHIDLTTDWLFIDDWAIEFAEKRWQPISSEIRSRVFPCDPFGDGSDIVEFLVNPGD